MITLIENAYAKLNLTLDVLGKRPDGYHDLRSVMQTVSACDVVKLELDTQRPWQLFCDRPQIPCDSRNLAWRAARVFFDAAKREPNGLTIHITKRIPSQAGMGGGSADAAAVLRALNRHYGQLFSVQELAELASAVGSDVPFCTVGGTVLVEGRGERLRALPALPDCLFVCCKPAFSASTPVLYRRLDDAQIARRPDHARMEDAILSGALHTVADCICNVFEPLLLEQEPEIGQIKAVLLEHGALAAQMTGSGSVVFGIMPGVQEAEAACRSLQKSWPDTFIARPV